MGAPSGGRAGLGGMSPGGGDYKGFFWVCCISYSPPKPLLILPSCTRFPARTPLPHLLGRGGFQLPHPQVILILRAKVIQEVIPVAVLPALCQLQRQACAVPVASRTTPERPPFIRAQRGQWALESHPPAPHRCQKAQALTQGRGPRTPEWAHTHLALGPGHQQGDVGVLLLTQDGHRFLPVLDIHAVYLRQARDHQRRSRGWLGGRAQLSYRGPPPLELQSKHPGPGQALGVWQDGGKWKMPWMETTWPTQEHVCSETHVEWETCSCRGHGGTG